MRIPEVWEDSPSSNGRLVARSGTQPMSRRGAAASTRLRLPPGRPVSQLTLTARLNTSALDSRRGVVRLHPEAIAAPWYPANGTRYRVDRIADHRPRWWRGGPGHATGGHRPFDDVTLSNAGLREDTTAIVAPVTVYGPFSQRRDRTWRRARCPGDAAPGAARQRLTVGDTVSLLPRDLGPGTSIAGWLRLATRGRHHLDLGACSPSPLSTRLDP